MQHQILESARPYQCSDDESSSDEDENLQNSTFSFGDDSNSSITNEIVQSYESQNCTDNKEFDNIIQNAPNFEAIQDETSTWSHDHWADNIDRIKKFKVYEFENFSNKELLNILFYLFFLFFLYNARWYNWVKIHNIETKNEYEPFC